MKEKVSVFNRKSCPNKSGLIVRFQQERVFEIAGICKFPQNGIDDFFEVIRQRYETGSIILTTNRKFEDWEQLFGDKVLASAIIDRLVHHAFIVKITGDSYRVKNVAMIKQRFLIKNDF